MTLLHRCLHCACGGEGAIRNKGKITGDVADNVVVRQKDISMSVSFSDRSVGVYWYRFAFHSSCRVFPCSACVAREFLGLEGRAGEI